MLSGASLWLGYRRARKQSKSLRFYILIEFIMSCLLLYLRPRGVMDTLVDGKDPIYYIAFLDVVRVISLLILTILMSCWPRDVPKYSEIFIDYEEKLLLTSSETFDLFNQEVSWRQEANKKLLPELIKYNEVIKHNIGLRLQSRLTKEQAKFVARCNSVHRDISLNF